MVLERPRGVRPSTPQDIDHAKNTAAIEAVALKSDRRIAHADGRSQVYKGADGWDYVRSRSRCRSTVTEFPGVPKHSDLTRSTDMRVLPMLPKPGTY